MATDVDMPDVDTLPRASTFEEFMQAGAQAEASIPSASTFEEFLKAGASSQAAPSPSAQESRTLQARKDLLAGRDDAERERLQTEGKASGNYFANLAAQTNLGVMETLGGYSKVLNQGASVLASPFSTGARDYFADRAQRSAKFVGDVQDVGSVTGGSDWVRKGTAAVGSVLPYINPFGLAGAVPIGGLQSGLSTMTDAEMAAQVKGATADEARAKSWAPAIASGLWTALVTRIGGQTGVEALSTTLPALIKSGSWKAIAKQVFGKQLPFEAAEEWYDEVGQSAIQMKSFNPELAWEDAFKHAAEAGVLGGIAAGVLAPMTVSKTREAGRVAERIQDRLVQRTTTGKTVSGLQDRFRFDREGQIEQRRRVEGVNYENPIGPVEPRALPPMLNAAGISGDDAQMGLREREQDPFMLGPMDRALKTGPRTPAPVPPPQLAENPETSVSELIGRRATYLGMRGTLLTDELGRLNIVTDDGKMVDVPGYSKAAGPDALASKLGEIEGLTVQPISNLERGRQERTPPPVTRASVSDDVAAQSAASEPIGVAQTMSVIDELIHTARTPKERESAKTVVARNMTPIVANVGLVLDSPAPGLGMQSFTDGQLRSARASLETMGLELLQMEFPASRVEPYLKAVEAEIARRGAPPVTQPPQPPTPNVANASLSQRAPARLFSPQPPQAGEARSIRERVGQGVQGVEVAEAGGVAEPEAVAEAPRSVPPAPRDMPPQLVTGPFEVGEKLVMRSPHTGDDTPVDYRGRPSAGQAVVWTGKSQFQVPEEWLYRSREAQLDTLREQYEAASQTEEYASNDIEKGKPLPPEYVSASRLTADLAEKITELERPAKDAAKAVEQAAKERTRNEQLSAREKRVAEAPAFQRRNGWDIVKESVDYALRHPDSKEEVYRGKLSRVRQVADESAPDRTPAPSAPEEGAGLAPAETVAPAPVAAPVGPAPTPPKRPSSAVGLRKARAKKGAPQQAERGAAGRVSVDPKTDELLGTNNRGEPIYWSSDTKTHYAVSEGRTRTAPWTEGLSESALDRLYELTSPPAPSPPAPAMDAFTKRHLEQWLQETVFDDERDAVRAQIERMVAYDPAITTRLSWPEIRDIATRNDKLAAATAAKAAAAAPKPQFKDSEIARLKQELAKEQKRLDKNVAKMGSMVPPPIVAEVTRKIATRMSKIQDQIDALESQPDAPTTDIRFSQTPQSAQSADPVTPEQDAAYLAAVGRGDMVEAQRMVDEAAKRAGYATEAWHYSASDGFNEFDPNSSTLGGAFFFSPVATNRSGRADALSGRRFFLRMQNPRRVTATKTVGGLTQAGNVMGHYTSRGLEGSGYDSIVGVDGNAVREYVVWKSDAIKSADPVTRDNAGRVIPLSERFNPKSNDIRFSAGAVSVTLTKEDAEEVAHKMGILESEPDLQESYGITQKQASTLLNSVPMNGGEWLVPPWAAKAVAGEMQDHASVLRGIAEDARSENKRGEALRINKQAKRFESLFTEDNLSSPSSPRFSTTDPAQVAQRQSQVTNAQAAVDAIAAEFPGAPPVTVVDTEADLPEFIRDAKTATVNGVYYRGRVWIVANAHATQEALARTYWHEIVGHHGVRSVLGSDADAFFESVARRFPNDRSAPTRTESERGEEILARLSEQRIQSLGILDRLMAPARRLLRRIAQRFSVRLEVSDAEIRELLYRSFRALRGDVAVGSTTPNGGILEVVRDGVRWVLTPPSYSESRYAITASHGTPWEIPLSEGFRKDKIGTGEGHAAYGIGFYIAGNPKVGENYRQALSDRAPYTVDGRPVNAKGTSEREAMMHVANLGFDRTLEDVEKRLLDAKDNRHSRPIQPSHQWAIEDLEKLLAAVESLRGKRVEAPKGNLYTVEFNADPADLLDWDKPLSEQPGKVSMAVRGHDGLMEAVQAVLAVNQGLPFGAPNSIARARSTFGYPASGDDIYYAATNLTGSKRAASELLASLGIKGIQYLDEGSRGLWIDVQTAENILKRAEAHYNGIADSTFPDNHYKSGVKASMLHDIQKARQAYDTAVREAAKATRNYVVFNEGDIKITHRNGERVTFAEATAPQDIRFSYQTANIVDAARNETGLNATTLPGETLPSGTANLAAATASAVLEQSPAGRAFFAAVDAARNAPLPPVGTRAPIRSAMRAARLAARATFALIRPIFGNEYMAVAAAKARLTTSAKTYEQLMADPGALPQRKSDAQLQALRDLQEFYRARDAFNAKADEKTASLTVRLRELLTNVAKARTDSHLGREAIRQFIDITNETFRISASVGEMQGLSAMRLSPTGYMHALRFMVANNVFRDALGAAITDPAIVMANIQAAAARVSPGNPVSQAVQAADHVITHMVDWVTKYLPLRDYVLTEAPNILNAIALTSSPGPGGKPNPFEKFKTKFAQAVADAAATRDFSGLPASLTRAIADAGGQREKARDALTAVTHELSSVAAALAGATQAVVGVNAIFNDQVFRDLSERVHRDNDARIDATGLTVDHKRYLAAIPGSVEFAEQTVLALDEHDKPTRDSEYRKAERWFDAATAYIADRTAPGWRADIAAGLERAVLHRTHYLDHMLNPDVKRMVPGPVSRRFNSLGLLNKITAIQKWTLRFGDGAAVRDARQKGNAWSESERIKQATVLHHYARWARALKLAVDSHKELGGSFEKYQMAVLNPLAASRQYFTNLQHLSAGDEIGNGHKVTGDDIAFLAALRSFENQLYTRLSSEAGKAIASIERSPLSVTEGTPLYRILRNRKETGPDTIDRSAPTMRTWADRWATYDMLHRIGLIDENAPYLIGAWLFSAAKETYFKTRFQFAAEMKSILAEAQGRALPDPTGGTTNRVESFDHLVGLVEKRWNANHPPEEQLTSVQVRDGLLAEADGFMRAIKDEADKAAADNRTKVSVAGSHNAFTFARGHQIAPAGWYDYGFTTLGGMSRLAAQSTETFINAYHESLEGLHESLKKEVQRLQLLMERGATKADIAKEARDGSVTYNYGQAVKFQELISDELENVGKRRVSLYNPREGFGWESGAAAMGYTIANLLSKGTVLLVNYSGPSVMASMQNATMRRRGFGGMAFDLLWDQGAKRMLNDLLQTLTSPRTPGSQYMRALLGALGRGPLTKAIFEPMMRQAMYLNNLYAQGNEDGLLRWNQDYLERMRVLWENRHTYGSPESKALLSQSIPARIGRNAVFVAKAITHTNAEFVQMVDNANNAYAIERAQSMRRALEEAVIKHGSAAMTAIAAPGSGGRWPDSLLTANWPDLTPQAVEEAATTLRDWFAREMGINLDAALVDFYRRYKAAEATEVATDAPVGSLTSKERLLAAPEFSQLRSQMAQDLNLGTTKNRPGFARSGQIEQTMSMLWGYATNFAQAVSSLLDTLSTKNQVEGAVKALPAFILAALAAGASGMLTLEQKKWWLEWWGKTMPVLTISDIKDLPTFIKAASSGLALNASYGGDIINRLAGIEHRSGYDLNSRFVALNIATQGVRALTEFTQMAVNGTFNPQPLIRFAEAYLDPVPGGLSRFLPGYAGIKETSNVRGLIANAARGEGLDALVRKPGGGSGGGVDVGPTTGPLGLWANAVAKGDTAGAKQYEQNAIAAYMAAHPEATEQAAMKSVHNAQLRRNPMSVLTNATDADRERVLGRMNPEQRTRVQGLIDRFRTAAASSVGARRSGGGARGGGGSRRGRVGRVRLRGGRGGLRSRGQRRSRVGLRGRLRRVRG